MLKDRPVCEVYDYEHRLFMKRLKQDKIIGTLHACMTFSELKGNCERASTQGVITQGIITQGVHRV